MKTYIGKDVNGNDIFFGDKVKVIEQVGVYDDYMAGDVFLAKADKPVGEYTVGKVYNLGRRFAIDTSSVELVEKEVV